VDTIARRLGAPVHRGEGRLVLEATIGPSPSAGAELEFLYISAVASDRDGSIWIVDERQPVVRQFAADGRFVRTLGRKGRGPGEYTLPRGVAVLPDGRIAVHDNGNRRINVYSREGAPLTSWPAEGSSIVRETLAPAPGGGLSLLMAWPGEQRSKVSLDDFPGRTLQKVYSTTGTVTHERPVPRPAGRSPYRRITFVSAAPFAPRRLWAWSPLGYFVTAFPNRYAFEFVNPSESVISYRRDAEAIAVKPAERAAQDAYTRMLLERAKSSAVKAEMPNEPGPPMPSRKPFFKDLHVDAAGRIWLELHAPAMPTGPKSQLDPRALWVEPRLYDIYEPDGRYLGRLNATGVYNIEFGATRGHDVWTHLNDNDGFMVLKKFRIVWND
jgi:hypothetical protein